MTTIDRPRVSPARRITAAAAAAGAALAIAVTGAGTAQAGPPASQNLTPNGGQVCTGAEYAGYQVSAQGSATRDGAKFKLVRNGAVVQNTPTRVSNVNFFRSSLFGLWDGAGYYQLCAVNTGNNPTLATVQIWVDGAA